MKDLPFEFGETYYIVLNGNKQFFSTDHSDQIVFNNNGTYYRTEFTSSRNNRINGIRIATKITKLAGKWGMIDNQLYLSDNSIEEYHCLNPFSGKPIKCEKSVDEIYFGKNEWFKSFKSSVDTNNILYVYTK